MTELFLSGNIIEEHNTAAGETHSGKEEKELRLQRGDKVFMGMLDCLEVVCGADLVQKKRELRL